MPVLNKNVTYDSKHNVTYPQDCFSVMSNAVINAIYFTDNMILCIRFLPVLNHKVI